MAERVSDEGELMFERLRAALDAALSAATPPPDLREMAGQMQDAVIQAKAGVLEMREALEATERELALERQEIATATRRRDLAAGIQDAETVEVAERFLAKHQERHTVLERKVAAQREELALAERDLAEMRGQLDEVTKRRAVKESDRSRDAAWASLGAAGVDRPEVDLEQEHLRSQMDRSAREAAADQALDALKKKMGKG
jgi:hypothetical protein